MDNGADWPRLIMPASAGERLAAVSPRTKSQPHTAAAPYLPSSRQTAQFGAKSTTALNRAHKAGSSAGASDAHPSSRIPGSTRHYSPSSPRAPRQMLAEAHAGAADPEATARANLSRKLSNYRQSSHVEQPAITSSAKVAPSSSAATARAEQVPEHRSRVQQPARALSSGGLEGDAQSAPSRRQVREPRAASHTLVDSGASPSRRGGTAGHAGHTAPRKAKREVYCGNNRMASVLLDGSERVGRPSECIQRGFGAALHQHVEDVEAFVRMHSGAYEKLIDPKLWYKNSEPPDGMQRATLPMCFQKGFGAGTAALARKLQQRLHGWEAGAGARARSAGPSQ